MEQIIRIGMDTSKHVFQLHGVNAAEDPVLRKKLRRKEMVAFFEKAPPTVIAIEACGGSHHWARLLRSFGHEVKLIPPQFVKPYVKRGKNDAADAEALCEAMSRPTMRFVPVKTADRQAALMLAGMRERLIRNRTQLANSIRGYAAEFGLTAAKGICKIEPLLERIAADETLPELARELFALHGAEYVQLQARLEEVDAKLMAWHRADECSRRLAQIPGVGPISASLLMMKTPTPEGFRSGRHFAAWIGLDAEGSFNRRQSQARRDYTRRRRSLAKHAGGWRDRSSCDKSATDGAGIPRPGSSISSSASRRSSSPWRWPTKSRASPGR